MKKKLSVLSLLLVLIFVLAACGSGNTDMNGSSTQSSAPDSMTSSSMSQSMTTLSGSFSGKNGKMVSGMVKVMGGKLMLTHFKTDEGPDLHVYLTKDGDVTNGQSIAKIDLKKMDQTFSLNGVDPAMYNTVVIYCNKAHVAFGEAKIMDPGMSFSGSFKGTNQKMVSGTATVTNTMLTLSNFKTDEGPDLHVYLTKDGDLSTGKQIAKIDLKKMEQSFSLSGIDPTIYNMVVIYCNKAHVTFGEAKLMMDPS
ncbi:hypothetical protein E4665_06215 [Sporolactobacillus shoreae]|uniref:DM13 domain-containing protein n=1 Tax=Sporolactobacillus shoreae TaxID=1465501 RepID=A0A4Z0GPJ1_9BACL|nr:DM13 domain-containing protein [Sporolactobacillus shoreae]TGA98918.1 hypothetical protein E4665_06215 [Sporolactobacillus shoreae]